MKMKNLALALFFKTILVEPLLAQWYKGGTLHRATTAEWASASASTRLATAGDRSVAILGERRVQQLGKNGVSAYARSWQIA
jgi:hypothetical protein